MTRERFLTEPALSVANGFGMTFFNGLLGVARLACPAVLRRLRFVREPRLDKPAVPPVAEIRAEGIRRGDRRMADSAATAALREVCQSAHSAFGVRYSVLPFSWASAARFRGPN